MNLNKGCIEIELEAAFAVNKVQMNLNKGCIEIFYVDKNKYKELR